jgi:GT2 family glycosyltransferase
MSNARFDTGIVVIGRNEGERLRAALSAIDRTAHPTIYVDSGSTDNSIALADHLGCATIRLDPAQPFSAGRGRNTGFDQLLAAHPDLRYVQFIDGDCILTPDWLEKGHARMESDPTLAIVCGRRRERFPEASVYNLLADMEWNTPVGEAQQCGGDAYIRVDAFRQVNGYDTRFAAGEEPEMCYRLRQNGWRIWRLDADMVWHDANMLHFGQWWQRTLRSGSAYAQSAWVHGLETEHFCLRDSISIWLWAALLPLLIVLTLRATRGGSLLLLAGYGVLFWRIFRYRRRHGDPPALASRYALFVIIGKFAQLLGQWRFLHHRRSALIEYK